MNQMFTPSTPAPIQPPRTGTPSKSPRPPVVAKATPSGTPAASESLGNTIPIAQVQHKEFAAGSESTPINYDIGHAHHDYGGQPPGQALPHVDAHPAPYMQHAAAHPVLSYNPMDPYASAGYPGMGGAMGMHHLGGMPPMGMGMNGLFGMNMMPHLGMMGMNGGMNLAGMHSGGLVGSPESLGYGAFPMVGGDPSITNGDKKSGKGKMSKKNAKATEKVKASEKAAATKEKAKAAAIKEKAKAAAAIKEKEALAAAALKEKKNNNNGSDTDSDTDTDISSEGNSSVSDDSTVLSDSSSIKNKKKKKSNTTKITTEKKGMSTTKIITTEKKGMSEVEAETAAAWASDPDLVVELRARKEREYEIEKKKRELAFNDMSKDMRNELNAMRDKYESIIKFDSAIHITLDEHRERLKMKQDEADHYIDSKLYEKQKIFDREIVEIKLKSQESDENYVKSMDQYKDVVKKLDGECHRLEAGWDDTRAELEKLKIDSEAKYKETVEELHNKRELEVAALQEELSSMKAQYEADIFKRNTEKEEQDKEMRIVKNINIEKMTANKKLTEDLKTAIESSQHAKEKAVAAMFRLKSLAAEKDASESQLERLKDAAIQLKKDLNVSKEKYDEIVLWAKNTEDAQKKHDDEMKKNMNAQHEKFNVEYDFLAKQNSALKDEVRTMKNEILDQKSILEAATDKMKDMQRIVDDKARKCHVATEHAEKLQVIVDVSEKKFDNMQRKLELIRERDLKLQENEMNGELLSMKRKVDIKMKLVEEMENKTEFLRNKIKTLEEIIATKDKKIDALDEQIVFESRMREINMQKRMEHENGGIDAVVSLLRINEMNAANLDRITESNAANLDTVREDIAKLVTRINTETVNKKKTNVQNKLAAVAEMVKMGHKLHEDEKERERKEKEGIPKRGIDMNKAQLHLSRTHSPERKEAQNYNNTIPKNPDGIYKDGHGRPILDPFHPSLGKPIENADATNENVRNNQSHGSQPPIPSLNAGVKKVGFIPSAPEAPVVNKVTAPQASTSTEEQSMKEEAIERALVEKIAATMDTDDETDAGSKTSKNSKKKVAAGDRKDDGLTKAERKAVKAKKKTLKTES
jgi:hypothetical protein